MTKIFDKHIREIYENNETNVLDLKIKLIHKSVVSYLDKMYYVIKELLLPIHVKCNLTLAVNEIGIIIRSGSVVEEILK